VPYLNVVKFCSPTNSLKCAPDVVYKNLDGTSHINWNETTSPRILLADGIIILFYLTKLEEKPALSVYVDINGHKKPNVLGRDVFHFSFYSATSEFLPTGVNGKFDEETGRYQKMSPEQIRQCASGSGMSCGAMIVLDGFKMNY